MKKFKNTFGIRCKNPHIIEALVATAKELGWGDQTEGDTFSPKDHEGMWFHSNTTANMPLKTNHFWFCNTITGTSSSPIYNLPAQWDEAIAAMSEVESFKVGDWVVVLPSDRFYDNAEQGIAQEIYKVSPGNDLPYGLNFSDGSTNSYREVRQATEAEIAHAKSLSNFKTVTLEESGRIVTVYRDGKCEAAGNEFRITEIQALLKRMGVFVGKASTGWSINIETVSVGCTGGITVTDLNNILNAYKECQR